MNLILDHIPADLGFKISHSETLFFSGSCFSQNIQHHLQAAGFFTFSNPSGILFNPLSIASELLAISTQQAPNPKHFLKRGDRWYSYHAHSSVNADSESHLLAHIQDQQQQAFDQLTKSSVIFITLGSAYYYKHQLLDLVVGNCHKQAQQTFTKLLASPSEIVASYKHLIQHLQTVFPTLKIVFTVSPVRHLRDGLVENTLSKSTLILAIHELINTFSNCHYFPAFELIAEDLKDYRFYEADLMHPNSQAINYVWQKFQTCFFNQKTQHLAALYDAYNKALAHRLRHTDALEQNKYDLHLNELKSRIANF